jgi:hypothetical protein
MTSGVGEMDRLKVAADLLGRFVSKNAITHETQTYRAYLVHELKESSKGQRAAAPGRASLKMHFLCDCFFNAFDNQIIK